MPNFEPKNRVSRQILRMWMTFLYKFVTLKELAAEGLTDSPWNTLENIKRPPPQARLNSFEAFLDIMRIFSSILQQSEYTSLFLNMIIFQKMAIFVVP